jgi:hypothetical protein
LGLGIAQLLGGFARWVEHRKTFLFFAPAMIWVAVLLLIHVQTWWSMFGLRFLQEWTFLRFGVVLLQPITLYLLSVLVLPSQGAPASDLRANYFAQRRWFFGLLAFLLFVSVAKDLIVSGSLPSTLNLVFHGVFLAVAAVALSTAREKVHHAVAVLSTLAIVGYVGLLFPRLL